MPLTGVICAALLLVLSLPTFGHDGHGRAGGAAGLGVVPFCTGDCDGSGAVSIAELITGVNIALDEVGTDACPAFDANGGGSVTIDELVEAVRNALSDCAGDEPITLSSNALAPGAMLTISHPSIVAGRAVQVTFSGPDGYRLTVSTDLTTDGAAQIGVPPFVDMESGRFQPGAVAVSIAGVDSEQTLSIAALPAVQAAPGELTVVLLDFTITNLVEVLDGLEALAEQTGIEQTDFIDAVEARIDTLSEMADEIDLDGQLTLETPTGTVILEGENLALLDRLVAAPFIAFAAPAGSVLAGSGAGGVPTRDEFADMVDRVKRQIISGTQTLGSYFSVTTGVVALIGAATPIGEIAGTASIASTGIVTLGTAGISFVTDLLIDAIRGRDPDVYQAARNAEGVFISGLRSIALTALGAVKWAGATLAGWASFANDSRDAVQSVRDHTCSTDPERQRRQSRGLSLEEFCRRTDETTGPTPTATTASRTPTPTRAASTEWVLQGVRDSNVTTRTPVTVTIGDGFADYVHPDRVWDVSFSWSLPPRLVAGQMRPFTITAEINRWDAFFGQIRAGYDLEGVPPGPTDISDATDLGAGPAAHSGTAMLIVPEGAAKNLVFNIYLTDGGGSSGQINYLYTRVTQGSVR